MSATATNEIPNVESGDYLQQPSGRAIEAVEEHLEYARALSRALYMLVSGGVSSFEDERDKDALMFLASEVAWHASAGECAYHREHLSNAAVFAAAAARRAEEAA